MRFVLWLHVLTAIFAIGPLAAVTSAAPKMIDDAKVEVVRFLARTTRIYTIASVAVFLLGLAAVPLYKHKFGEVWLSSSMTLYLVAVGLLVGLIQRDLTTSVTLLDAGETAEVQRGRIFGVGIAVNLIWLIIILLMVYRPGGA